MSRKSKEATSPGKGSAVGAHPASETHDPIKFKLGSNQPLGLWRQDWLLTLLLVIVTMLAYLPAWNGTPIWDDDAHLTKQELRSLEGLGRIWTQPGATQQYYPLVHTLFWVEHQLWGDCLLVTICSISCYTALQPCSWSEFCGSCRFRGPGWRLPSSRCIPFKWNR